MAAEKNFPDTIRDNFSVVTGQTVDLTAANIKGLRANQAASLYFSTRIASLPWAYIPDANGEFHRDGFDERVNYLGGGTYGQVFQGITSRKAYKKMTMPPDNDTPIKKELYYREIYLEAFIQTVLQNDARYGQNIGAIEKIYKDQMPDGTSRNVFYYQMETINNPNGLTGYLNSQKGPTGLVPRSTLLAILRQLATILEYFRMTYGFYHRDLHVGNVMFHDMTAELAGAAAGAPIPADLLPGNRRIKIIDFGMACMKPKGRVFSVEGGGCISIDLLIYITSLFDYRDMFDAESITFLNGLFTKEIEGITYNLYNMINDYTRISEHIPNFHLVYHYRFSNRDPFWGRTLHGVGVTMMSRLVGIWGGFYPYNFLTKLNTDFPVVAAPAPAPAAPAPAPAAAFPAFPPLPSTLSRPSGAVSSVSSGSSPYAVAHVATPRPGSAYSGFFSYWIWR
jgi:serine/threonine protein kinase